MPEQAAIVLVDTTPTPDVNYTFGPVKQSGDEASWAERSGGIPIGYGQLSISIRPPSAKSLEKYYLVTARVTIPTLEVTSPSTMTGIQPAPTVAYKHIAEVKFWLSDRGTSDERLKLRDFASYLVGDTAQLQPILQNLEGFN